MRPYTFKQIQTFLEVARQGSVSKAAERLFVTQPAVSMQLRQLEDAFGLALVEPMGRNIKLTAAGEVFLTHATSAMGQFRDLEALMAEHVGLKKGRIDLAVVSTAKYFVPMLLVRFNKLYPDIEVYLNIDNRENVLGLLSRFETDLVVMGRAPSHLDCVATPLPPTHWPWWRHQTTPCPGVKTWLFQNWATTALWCGKRALAPVRPCNACLTSTRPRCKW